jgi:hypothetical protein
MIRFSLVCEAGHEFESWFPSGDAYEAQRMRGLLSCPICDSGKVEKALMAPSLGRKGNQAKGGLPVPVAPPDASVPAEAPPAPVALLSEKEQAMRAMIRAVREHVTQNAENVGRGFADEARRMHYGETPHRSIWGEADAGEAKALVEEGIEFHALPPAPDDRN